MPKRVADLPFFAGVDYFLPIIVPSDRSQEGQISI